MIKLPFKALNAVVAFVVAAAVLMAFANHTPTSASRTPAASQVVRLAYYEGENGQLAATLDPAQISAADDYNTAALQYRALVIIGTNNKAIPDLASKITHSKDLKTWTFTLRNGLKFSNGDPITSADVVWSIERALAPSTNSQVAYYDNLIKGYDAYTGGKASHLSGLKAPNKSTVVVTITKPAAYFLKAFSYPINDVLDKKRLQGKEAGPNNNYLTSTCSGNISDGPFKFKCLNSSSGPGSFYNTGATPVYTLVPNPKFYGPKPKVTIKIPALANTDVGYKDYLAGQVDETGIPSANLAGAKGRSDYHQAPTSTIGYISLSTKLAPFNNVNCRLAIAWGLNRSALMAVIHNASNPLYTILPPGFPSYDKSILSKVPKYNMAKAKSYFAKCPNSSTPVTYWYNTSSADSDHLAEAIVNMMNIVGFKAKASGTTVHDWLHRVNTPLSSTNTQAIRNGWAQDYPDPQDYISLLFRCGNAYDISEWCNSSFDKLVDQADKTGNAKQRTLLYSKAQTIALNAGIPVMYDNGVAHLLISKKVHGLGLYAAWSDIVPKNLDWSTVSVS